MRKVVNPVKAPVAPWSLARAVEAAQQMSVYDFPVRGTTSADRKWSTDSDGVVYALGADGAGLRVRMCRPAFADMSTGWEKRAELRDSRRRALVEEAAHMTDDLFPPSGKYSANGLWLVDCAGVLWACTDHEIIRIRDLKGAAVIAGETKGEHMFGKNVTIRNKNVDGIVCTVYVQTQGDAPKEGPLESWWLHQAVITLEQAAGVGAGQRGYSDDKWVLVRVGQ